MHLLQYMFSENDSTWTDIGSERSYRGHWGFPTFSPALHASVDQKHSDVEDSSSAGPLRRGARAEIGAMKGPKRSNGHLRGG